MRLSCPAAWMTGSCDSMATTSIWRVKGWLGKVVIYVENPDKTDNPAFYEKRDMSDRQVQGLSDVIDYAVNNEKTQTTDEAADVVQQFVSGVNCHPGTAREEMLAVKRQFGKEDGTVSYNGYQSFAPGEATPELAHEIGVKLAKQLWGEKYQVIVATHLDKSNHLHNGWPGLYCPGHHDLHSCGSGLPGRETPCRRKIYCSFHFGYVAYGDYTGKHRGHSGHVDSVSMLHDYAVCTNDDYGLVLYFNNKNQ